MTLFGKLLRRVRGQSVQPQQSDFFGGGRHATDRGQAPNVLSLQRSKQ